MINLSPERTEDVKNTFQEMYDLTVQRQSINTSITEKKSSLSDRLGGVSKKVISKAFTRWVASIESKNEEEDIVAILENIL